MMTPFFPDWVEGVRPEWIDGGHLAVAYYMLIFDHATDAFREHLGLGGDYALSTGCGMAVAEAHLCYMRELHRGDVVRIRTRLIRADGKRVHLFHEVRTEPTDNVAATGELMLIHVDRRSGRAIPLAATNLAQLQRVSEARATTPAPLRVGRAIAFDHPEP
jgi:acyl-CoA thioester hydrolase